MQTGFAHGELVLEERAIRSGDQQLRGRFPYNTQAVLSDGGRSGGRPKKERFAARAFNYRIARPDEDIHILVGHSYDRPLASRSAGTLDIKDDDEAVTFVARITAEVQQITWVRDAFTALSAGLVGGLSPGFRLPPPSAVKEPERVEEEDPSLGRALIRVILAALLYEFSLVTRPAYGETEVSADEERSAAGLILPRRPPLALNRWRL